MTFSFFVYSACDSTRAKTSLANTDNCLAYCFEFAFYFRFSIMQQITYQMHLKIFLQAKDFVRQQLVTSRQYQIHVRGGGRQTVYVYVIYGFDSQFWLYHYPAFSGCCKEHDLCYDKCGSKRRTCDKELWKCTMRMCTDKVDLTNEADVKAMLGRVHLLI